MQLGPPAHTSFCTGSTTRTGCHPRITAVGNASATGTGPFWLFAELAPAQPVVSNDAAVLFYGVSGRSAIPFAPGGTSVLCAQPPLQRMPLIGHFPHYGVDCFKWFAADWNAHERANPAALGQPFSAGQIVQAQACVRDDAAPLAGNLTDAVEFTLGP